MCKQRCGPKSAGDVSANRLCGACHKAFCEGDYTVLVDVGPGDNKEARLLRDQGRPHKSVALEVHWDCAPSYYRVTMACDQVS